MLSRLLEIQEGLRLHIPDVELISPEEIRAIEYLWMYDGGTVGVLDDSSKFEERDDLEKLLGRLIAIEDDMSDLSKRVGVYKKLEAVIQEYTMNQMVSGNDGGNR